MKILSKYMSKYQKGLTKTSTNTMGHRPSNKIEKIDKKLNFPNPIQNNPNPRIF